MIDTVVHRHKLNETLGRIIDLLLAGGRDRAPVTPDLT